MAFLLGVDLGTTFTAAAVSDGRSVTMVGLGNRALQVPSVLFLSDGQFLVGEVAERRGLDDPSRVVREFKRRLGDPVPIIVGGSPYPAEALTSRLLRWVVDRAAERMGERPERLVLTHPANWGEYKLAVFARAVELADVGPASWCPEPVAAAARYAARARVPAGSRLAVYDLGGGTFDACVLETGHDGCTILGSPEGIEHLGGADFDQALFHHLRRSLGDRLTDLDPSDPVAMVALARLRRDCVEAKEGLSSDAEVVVPVSLPGLNTSVRVSRGEFEAMIRPALQNSVAALGRALRSAAVEPAELAGIVLVGGSSRIPLVAELLEEFAAPIAVDTHPKHDIVLGALQARNLASALATPTPQPPVAAQPPVADQPPEDAPTSSTLTRGRPLGPRPRRPTTTAAEDAGPPRFRRRPLLLALCGVAVAAVVVIAAVRFGAASGADGPPAGGPTEEASPAPSAARPSSGAAALPRSAPASPTQLIVPMRVGGNWDLYLADTQQAGPGPRLTSDPAAEYGQVLSPDRRTVVYLRVARGSNRRTLWVAGAVDGQQARPLFDPVPSGCAATAYRPAWNPVDVDQLAVPCTDQQGHQGLYLMRTDGSDAHEITLPGAAVDDPAFSPDGTKLAFWSGSDPKVDGGNLYVVTLDGSAPVRQLTSSTMAGRDADPTWSPNAGSIVFRRRVVDGTPGGNTDLATAAVDGSSPPKLLTHSSADEGDPSFSPSGQQIAYQSTRATAAWPQPAVARVWVMNADGSHQHLLWSKRSPGQQAAPAWSRR